MSKAMQKSNNKKTSSKLLAIGVCTGLALVPVVAAAAFNVDAGVNAATGPLITGLTEHWGKGVLLSGGTAALMGEGDPRQRAQRAVIGCAAAGGVVLGLIALLT